ncbi:MAG: VOC family protein [Anaerolineae bacterium]|nr:VOC family protein [Anaerolineae bacterium]
MINRLQVTNVFVSDQNKAHDFYVNKLGLKVKVDMNMPGMRWLEVIPDGAETSISLSLPWPGMSVKGGATGMLFDTSDVNGAYATLKARGVHFSQEPTAQPWGGIEARFTDPDGNEFALVQRTA